MNIMRQAEIFSKSMKSISRGRWTQSVLEKTIVKVIRDGLNACRIPNYEVKARTPCAKCHLWTVAASEPGIPDIIGWIPLSLLPAAVTAVPFYVEVKRPQGGLESQAQKQFIERVQRDHGLALFARGWDEVAGYLRSSGVQIPDGL